MMMTSVMTLALTTECACVQGSLTVSVAGCDWTYCVEDQDVSAVQDVGRHHLNKNKQNSLSIDIQGWIGTGVIGPSTGVSQISNIQTGHILKNWKYNQ